MLLDEDENVPVLRIKQRDPAAAPQPVVQVTRTVGIGRIDVDAGFDAAYVRRSLRREIAHFERCYDDALASDPGIAGTVVAKFVIGVDGRVPVVAVSGVVWLDRCVGRALRRIAFGKPANGVSVEATLVFTVTQP